MINNDSTTSVILSNTIGCVSHPMIRVNSVRDSSVCSNCNITHRDIDISRLLVTVNRTREGGI